MAVSVADARRMRDAAAASSGMAMCTFNYRFMPAVRMARDLIASGKIGEALPGRENIVDEQRMCDPHYQMLEAIETRGRAKAEQAYQAVLSISGLL